MEDNLTQQIDEVEALSAIYGAEWCVLDEYSRTYCIGVTDGKENSTCKVCLQVLLPPEYPSNAAPLYQLNAPWLKHTDKEMLTHSLDELCSENSGECVLYLLVERVREILVDQISPQNKQDEDDAQKPHEDISSSTETATEDLGMDVDYTKYQINTTQLVDELPDIQHGDPITDRRSTFQAHLASPVVTQAQVKQVLGKLYENRKIANATHNISAYRIYCESRDSMIQDCDDDGECAAGGRLLHLLQIVDARNVLVVVSRWYGGIMLGPDRFKHINNAARNVLKSGGVIEDKESGGSSNAKGKSSKNKNKNK